MTTFVFESKNEQDTARFGAALAQYLRPGDTVALCGPLGAGKTRLVQAVAAAADVDTDQVTSPTFTLVHEYAGSVPIYHVDAYRLADPDEFAELGLEEYFDSAGWTLVEWGDKFPECLPVARLEVRIDVVSPECRTLHLEATAADPQTVVDRVAELLRT